MNWWLIPIGFLSGICASMGIGGGFVLMLYLTLFAGWLSNEWISKLFALLILVVGIKELFGKKESG